LSKAVIYSLFFLICGIVAILLNVFLIERLIIPDICYYHSHQTTFYFDIFFSFPPSEGGHPVTSNFSIVLSFLIGGILGFYFTRKKMTHY